MFHRSVLLLFIDQSQLIIMDNRGMGMRDWSAVQIHDPRSRNSQYESRLFTMFECSVP